MTAISIPLRRQADWQLGRGTLMAILLAVSALLYVVFRGQWTLPFDADAPLFLTINEVRDWIDLNRDTAPLFVYVFDPIRQGVAWLVDSFTFILQSMSWIGVTAIAGAMGLVFVGRRTAVLVVGSFLAFGLMGLWDATIETLALTLAGVVLSLLVGIPLGIVAGRSDRFLRLISPVLDVMQIMPTFAYLAPLTLIFLIGPPAATICTLIYAVPATIRITALGIRGVSHETIEAADSLGSTRFQILRKVQLPMARSTIGLAVNQTIMMALSMIVITALIAAPGLGVEILDALAQLDIGRAFEAGLAVVLLAMVLDRLTARASQVSDRRHRGEDPLADRRRRMLIVGSWSVAGVLLLAGQLLPLGEQFPADWRVSIAAPINDIVAWIEQNLYPITDAIKNFVTEVLLNPIEGVLTNSPWWLVFGSSVGVAWIVSGRRAAITVAVALAGLIAMQLWEHSMETLALVLVALSITLVLGIALGVGSGRSHLFAKVMRPINDAAQTMPAFVYLLPAVALFGATRFTAILAAVIYAAPAVIRLVEDGIRGVSPTAIEAATAAGSSRLQIIRKVQIPMAHKSLLVATNQGVVLVLAMVVVGGLVGAGALGYDVVAGFSQFEDFGKGMAAAISIVLLGVILDRITQGAGAREKEQLVRQKGIPNAPLPEKGIG
jgi:glycine betaine/proline transport system permease protein